MTFKEFEDWCNKRACDGCWSIYQAVTCANIIKDVRSKPFWGRKKYWKNEYESDVTTAFINPINKKIAEMKGVV